MDTPKGFDSWSDECKRAFERLKAEWEARLAAEAASERADAVANKKKAEAEALQSESDAIDEWLDGYRAARRAKKEELDARKDERKDSLNDLKRDLRERHANGEISKEEAESEYREAKAEHDAEVDTLKREFDELADERRRKRARKRELGPELEIATAAAAAAREDAEKKLDELDNMKTEDQIVSAYFALLVRCGPKDPEPGETIEVPLEEVPFEAEDEEGENGEEEESPWQDAVRRWFNNLVPWFGFIIPGPEKIFVGAGSDHQLAALTTPSTEQQQGLPTTPKEITPIRVQDGPTWREGCIEFLWVQGTHPKADPRTTSNPITVTLQWAMRNVNEIWGSCECVRFKAYLTVVTLQQLGNIANAANGISVVDGRTRSASNTNINGAYSAKVKELQKHKECTGFLVVDSVDGAAGFGGGGTGVVTINRVGHQQNYGDTTAHELGHALAGISHVENEGENDERKHEHGELMWGKGCNGYPTRENRRYSKVTAADCTAMKKALRDTGEPCGESVEPM